MIGARTLLASITVGAGIAAAILHAPHAQADTATDQFLDDAHSIGFINTDELLIGVGYQVCSALAAGNSAALIAETIYLNTDLSVTWLDAQLFTLAAIANLCPQQGLDAASEGRPIL